MTIETWIFVIIFLFCDVIALFALDSSCRADKKLEAAQDKIDRLKDENEELRREIRKLEVFNLCNEHFFGGK